MSFDWISNQQPSLILAPMEGVTDVAMRALLSERGGFDFCVSEFLRISQEVLPKTVFLDHVPEYLNRCQTPSGTPVQIQLLGGNEEKMAMSALQAVELGAKAIDLNFGCPSPQVNRNDGGASLLRYPDRIYTIVSEVRNAVPKAIPVSAKLRLGWESMEDIYRNADLAAQGGASWLTIHARTKVQGYTPPAHWKYIGEVKKQLGLPIVANGEIWTKDDFLKCQEITQCQHFMLGRGALANPSLVHNIAKELGLRKPSDFKLKEYSGFNIESWQAILKRFAEISAPISKGNLYTLRKMKQWLKLAHLRGEFKYFDKIKTTTQLDEFFNLLNSF